MSISRVSFSTNNGTGVTLGTHAKGDLILYSAYFAGLGAPSLPPDVLGLYTRSNSGGSHRLGYYIAESDSETTGTSGWTGASNVTAIAYRGGPRSVVIPTILSQNGSSSTVISYAAQAAITSPVFKESALDLWLVGLAATRATGNNLSGLAPSGMTFVNNSIGVGFEVASYDTNSTRSAIWPATNVTQATSVVWATFVLELLEIDHKTTSGGGGGSYSPIDNILIG
jgi:hypothetical protein